MKIKIIKGILIITGFFWIFIVIYRYLILQRETIVLQPSDSITYKIILLIILGMHIYALFLSQNSKFKLILHKTIDFIYWKPLLYIFEIIFKDIDGVGDILLFLSEKFRDLHKVLKSYFGLIMSLILLEIPKILLAVTYFIDIYCYNKLSYFVKCLPTIVVFLLLARMVIFILKDFASQNMLVLEQYIDIVKDQGSYQITLKDGYEHLSKKLTLYAYRYCLFLDLQYFCNKISDKEIEINYWLTPVILSLYAIGTLKILLISEDIFIKDILYVITFICISLFILFVKKRPKI